LRGFTAMLKRTVPTLAYELTWTGVAASASIANTS
jgi:hypothetical protein